MSRRLMGNILIFTWILFCPMLSFADITTYLKPAKNKSHQHSMMGIDFIYTINLDQRPEKFHQCLEQFEPYNITPYRFSAVNGWELSIEAINEIGVKLQPGMQQNVKGTSYLPGYDFEPVHTMHLTNYGRTYFCHCMSRGAIGIVLSHLSVLQDAYDSGYETIWVMEDDVEIVKNPHELSYLIDQLDRTVGEKGWDILFTDQDTRNTKGEYVRCTSAASRPNFKPTDSKRFGKTRVVGGKFRKIGARYGAYSMIVRRSGMKKILDFIKKHNIFLPYDMDFYLPENVRMYTVCDDIVRHVTGKEIISDNGSPNYLNKSRG